MKKIYSLMLLVVVAFTSIPATAKETWPWVESVELYANTNNWEEPIAQFDHVGAGEWKLNDIEMLSGTEFKFKLHVNYSSGLYVYDLWLGTPCDDVETIKNVQPGTVVWCRNDDQNPAPNFRIGHDGKFSFAFDQYGLDELCFQIEGQFYPAYFLSGDFNNWGEEQFTAWVGSYSLAQKMSGMFEVIDQDYNELGGVTDDLFYLITEENPSVALATEAEGKKQLCLLNEGYYDFIIQNGILTISNWPVEEITVSIVGSTEPDWNVDWATTIPLTLDEKTGFYVSEETAIPKDFHCRVVKHSSLTSVPDVFYGTSGAFEVLEGGDYFPLTSSEGKDISFTGNGVFTFSVTQDFSALTTTGTYSVEPEYFLIGEFNNWNQDEMVSFDKKDGVSTLTKTFGGEFLIKDQFGNWLGGSTTEDNYLLTENNPSVTLTRDNKKNLSVKDESEYTLTINDGELTVSGWPVESISAWLLGATEDDWLGNEVNFELPFDWVTGNYVLSEAEIPAGYRFKVVKRSSLTSVEDVWYGANAEGMYWITDQTLGTISLDINGMNMYFDNAGKFSFAVTPDFSTVDIKGQFYPKPDPTYFLIGEFNNWDEGDMVPFDEENGAITLTRYFCGDFLIKDRDGNWIGANVGGDNERFIFTEAADNVAISSASDKKNFCVELPSEYTLAIDGCTLLVTGFPTEGYFIAGDFNDWKADRMNKNDDGTYSIVETFFDHNRFKFRDHEANWYGGNTEGGGDTYEIHDGWCTDIPLTMGDLGANFIIHAADTYKIVLSEGDDGLKLTVSKEAVSITDGISSLAGTDTVGVKFINLAGQVSTKPFAGMNIVVTNRSDGSTTVRKAICR